MGGITGCIDSLLSFACVYNRLRKFYDMANRYVVIMAGGRGERFWPESRLSRPKQLLPIVGDKAMLAQTVERLDGLVSVDRIFVITNAEQRDAVLEVCPELDPAKVIGEPIGRDTAAAVALATILVKREDPNGVFAMLPADAVIHDAAGLRSTLESAYAVAESDSVLATVGITAQFPATGYGYIQQGDLLGEFAARAIYKVQRFVEKPDEATAKGYLSSGDYFWNAGMFVWSVATISGELEVNTPSLWKAVLAIESSLINGDPINDVLAEHYPSLEKISIDYAVIEKSSRVVMVESGFDWDDVGAWPALARHYPADAEGNVARGHFEGYDASNNIVYSRDSAHLIALVGVQDLIVVKTDDATLVCHRDQAQKIKDLVKQLGVKEALKHLI